MEWYLKVVRDNYVNFDGRARRQEYWMFTLIHVIIIIALAIFFGLSSATEIPVLIALSGIAFGGYVLGTIIPSLAVRVRRLHDTNKSGWFYLISFLPFGGIVLFVFMVIEGDRGSNNYGFDPKNLNTKFELEDNLLL